MNNTYSITQYTQNNNILLPKDSKFRVKLYMTQVILSDLRKNPHFEIHSAFT